MSNSANDSRVQLIKLASWIALLGNAFLAILKVTVGLSANSLAVLGDGIDSSTDVVIALVSLFVAGIIAQPADANHPWGHARAETMATTVLAFILFFAGAQLIMQAVERFTHPSNLVIPSRLTLIVTSISIAGKLFLAWSQEALGKKAGSAMLKANAANMKGDVLTSVSILVGLLLSILFKLAIIDSILAVLVGLWIIRNAFKIFMEANLELMDGTTDRGPYASIFEAVRSIPGAKNPHRARMRRIAGTWDIDLDIEVDGALSVSEAHEISSAVEKAIRERVEGVYDIMVHVEPEGDRAQGTGEVYGLTEQELDAKGSDEA